MGSAVSEIKGMNEQELRSREKTLREDLAACYLKFRTGQLQKTSEINRIRKEVARTLTMLNELKLRSRKKDK